MTSFFAVVGKELRDATRDRRTLFAGFSYAIFGPLMLWFIVTVLAQSQADRTQTVRFCNAGASSAALEHALENDGFVFSADAGTCIRPAADFAQALAAKRPARVTIVAPRADDTATEKLQRALDRVGDQLAMQRLIVRGVAPAVVRPLDVAVENHGSAPIALVVVGMLIPFFVCAPLVAGLATAIDTTAGERERRSLEPLLAQPVGRTTVMLAKWCMTAAIGTIGLALTVGVGFAALSSAPLPELGVRLSLDWASGLRVFVLLVPLALSIAALQLFIGLGARTHKEGQSYLTLLTFIPVTAGVLAAFAPHGASGQRPIPMLWEVTALRSPLLGAPLDAATTLMAVLANFVLCAACLILAVRLVNSPRVVGSE